MGGAEKLVLSLWAVVIAYWLWARRPARRDTIGLFRYELRVLQHATPMRVPPANRRCEGGATFLLESSVSQFGAGQFSARFSAESSNLGQEPDARDMSGAHGGVGPTRFSDRQAVRTAPGVLAPLGGASLKQRQAELRRRRRDVLSVLAVAVVLSLLVALMTGSSAAYGAQALCDAFLAVYGCLLLRVISLQVGAGYRRSKPLASRPGDPRQRGVAADAPQVQLGRELTSAAALALPSAPAVWRPDVVVYGDDGEEPVIRLHERRDYVPAHSLSRPRHSDASYGDFESYASLALANAD